LRSNAGRESYQWLGIDRGRRPGHGRRRKLEGRGAVL